MSSQVGAQQQQQPTTTEQRRGEQKQKEQKHAEAIITDETTKLGEKRVDEHQTQKRADEPQTQTQTQQATQQQQHPEQTRQRPQPFHYTVHYTTSSIEKEDGQRETKEKFEMRNPEMDMVAERRPGQDLYDVRVEKKTGDKPEVITQQLPPNQVRDHIDQCLKDTNRKLDENLRLEYRPEQPEQRRPAIQGAEWIRPTGEQRALGLFERPTERSVGLFERPTERSVGLFDRPTERSLGLHERPLDRTLGLLERPFEGALGRRQDVFNDPFRMYDTFDHDFRRMEDEFRRMRETMTRSFRDFERRWY